MDEVRLECEEHVTEDSDTSDNEAFSRNSNSSCVKSTTSTSVVSDAVTSPPYSPVKIVGKSGYLEPAHHGHIQKPKTMTKTMKIAFNDDYRVNGKSPRDGRWNAGKVIRDVNAIIFINCVTDSNLLYFDGAFVTNVSYDKNLNILKINVLKYYTN